VFWRRAATAHRFSIEAAGGLALGDGDVAAVLKGTMPVTTL
jgi:hypothetical protein